MPDRGSQGNASLCIIEVWCGCVECCVECILAWKCQFVHKRGPCACVDDYIILIWKQEMARKKFSLYRGKLLTIVLVTTSLTKFGKNFEQLAYRIYVRGEAAG